MSGEYDSVGALVAALIQAEERGWRWAGTRTADGPEGIIVTAGTRADYEVPVRGDPHVSSIERGIVASASTADYRHQHRIAGADDLRDAVDECVTRVQALRHAARPESIIALDSAVAAYAQAADRLAHTTSERALAIRGARGAGHSVGEIAARTGLTPARIYQVLS